MTRGPYGQLLKPSRVARLNERQQQRRDRETGEKNAKVEARRRDGNRCRFPLCGCHKLRRRLESAHIQAKSLLGANEPGNLITFCVDRHQLGEVSLHHKTLRVHPLTDAGTDGPVRFLVDSCEFPVGGIHHDVWIPVAEETAVGVLAPLAPWQRDYLEKLGRMTR